MLLYLLSSVIMCISILGLMEILPLLDNNPQLMVDIITGSGSLIIAGATFVIYLQQKKVMSQQNNIIKDQTRATTQARKASIQTLDMTYGDSVQDILVEISNSGGGSAENLRAVVEFDLPASIKYDLRPFEVPAQRRTTTSDRSQDKVWRASEGNTIAADERQVPIEIKCAVHFNDDQDAHSVGFPAAVRRFAKSWRVAQLDRLAESIPATRLIELGDDWGEPMLKSLGDGKMSDNADQITTSKLAQIIATLEANPDDNFEKEDRLDRTIQMTVRLQYDDAYLKSIGEPATTEVPVLDATFLAKDDIQLEDIFVEDYRTWRQEQDPEGSALRM